MIYILTEEKDRYKVCSECGRTVPINQPLNCEHYPEREK